MLVGSYNGGVDHGVLVVRVQGQRLKDLLPTFTPTPAHVAQVHHPKVAKALGQIAPGDIGSVAIEHGFDEQAVILGRRNHLTNPAW